MSLKSRIEKLEQLKGVNEEHKLMIFEMHNARRPPTEDEIEAYKKSMDAHSPTAVLWNGEQFSRLDDFKEADNPLTETELAEIRDKRLAEIRVGL